jgi:hypothetical protein
MAMRKNEKKIVPLKILKKTLVPLIFWSIIACQSNQNNMNLDGEELAKIYCTACHLAPDPQRITKEIWATSVLPHMSWRLGIPDSLVKPPIGNSTIERLTIANASVFPVSPQISDQNWNKIKNYYLQNAPEVLPPQIGKINHQQALPTFSVIPIRNVKPGLGGATTMIRYNPMNQKIYLSDMEQQLLIFNQKGEIESKNYIGKVLTDIAFKADGSTYLLAVGNINPNDEEIGELLLMDTALNLHPLITGLRRPVHLNVTDLDGDGEQDIIICEFGNQTGRVSWYRPINQKTYAGKNLLNLPGAIKTFITDINEDKKKDIIVLMAQGNEGVFALINQDKENFELRPLLRFDPVFGSSDMLLIDFDKDDDLDIILVNGDNADYSHILKNYHGVHIFLNQGEFEFVEKYFYPIYGATRVVATDFDHDGDIDIASSSFFPDFTQNNPESFTYLQNQSDSDSIIFLPFTFPEANSGRWMLMELADLENDFNPDILLGSSTVLPLMIGETFAKKWKDQNLSFVILESKGL